MKSRILIRAMGVGLLLCGMSRADMIELRLQGWLLKPEGTISFGTLGQLGSDVDVRDDLGYDEAEGIGGFSAVLGDMHQVGVDYLSADLSAENRITRDIRFLDLTFRVGADVDSQMEATLVRPYYRFKAGSDIVAGGFLAGAQYIDFAAELNGGAFGAARESVEALVPVAGLHLELHPLPFLHAGGSLVGTSFEWDDVEAEFIDLQLHAIAEMPPGIFAGLGWRYLMIDGKDNDSNDAVDVTLTGPSAFVGVRF